MAEPTVRKKKPKVVEKEDGRKASKSKDVDGISSKRSSSPKKERKLGQKKENTDLSAKLRLAVGSADFEAGVIFNRYDKAQKGVITAEEFRQIWREGKLGDSCFPVTKALPLSPVQSGEKSNHELPSFEVGQTTSDMNSDVRIAKKDFENLLREHPELLKLNSDGMSSSAPKAHEEFLLPTEVITGRLLTHYDETAGVALPHSATEQHRRLGNTVLPLLESYRSRYDRLRGLLTGKLLPRRENLLQLRRQLQNCSAEVEAARKGIERETLSDAEQILERLRSVEAMRQSSIKHQVLQIEVELETVERVVRRIEQANCDSSSNQPSGILLTSAAPGSAPDGFKGPRAAIMVELIQEFADLSATINKLAVKTLSVQTDFPTDDFPRETAERLEILSRCDQYIHAVSVKDHMLWTVLKEKERQQELLEVERKLSHEYAEEMAKWAEVSESLTQQVLRLQRENEKLERTNYELVHTLRDNNVCYVPTQS